MSDDQTIHLKLGPATELALIRALDEVKADTQFSKIELMRLEALKLAMKDTKKFSNAHVLDIARAYYEYLKNG